MKTGRTLHTYMSLCKGRIPLFAALTAVVGFLLTGRSNRPVLLSLTVGVFLLACGAAAFNQVRERRTDALMARTADRPLPSGCMPPAHALSLSAMLMASGSMILLAVSPAAALLGLAAVLWYDLVYVWLKTRSPFAVIPGALVGAIPPAMGWIAGGGYVLDPRMASLCFFLFMWQVPHFFSHLLVFGKEYEAAGLPSLTAVLRPEQLERLTFHWLLAAAVSLQLIQLNGLIRSGSVRLSLLVASFWIVIRGFGLLQGNPERYRLVFKGINMFMLIVMLLLCLDKLPFRFSDGATGNTGIEWSSVRHSSRSDDTPSGSM
jgi:heme o synthase